MDKPGPPGSAISAPRRVFTAPTTHATHRQSSPATNGVVETLYHHPSVKIVSFTAGPRPTFDRVASGVEVQPGSLSPSSQMERTIAVGPFRIYRAPGSVAFLNCGSALQPILPKSQCWCVDEESSKYVLQIRRPQYWRIEVPTADEHDVRLALELREVLDTILQFEKTECPFRRSFTVELPERPNTPVKKRPWTPAVRHSISAMPPTPTPITPPNPETPKTGEQKGEAVIPDEKELGEGEFLPVLKDVPAGDATRSPTEPPCEKQVDEIALIRKVDAAVSALEQNVRKAREEMAAQDLLRPNGFQASRSVTAPPQLTLVTPQPSATLSSPVVSERADENSHSHLPTGSQESFNSTGTFTAPITPLPPSPPLTAEGSPQVQPGSEDTILVKKRRQYTPSDDTIIPNTPTTSTGDSSEVTLVNDKMSSPGTPATNSNGRSTSADLDMGSAKPAQTSVQKDETTVISEDETPITKISTSSSSSTASYTSATSATSPVLSRRPYMRHRPTTSSSISPSRASGLPRLPSAANLFSSYRNQSKPQSQHAPTRLSLVKRLPMAVIQKTVEILFSPPSHLIALMLKVAARITAGEWSGYVFGFGEQGERIPVRWDWSDEDDDGEGELGGWHADQDFGFSRHHSAAVTPLKMAGAFPESPDEHSGDERGREFVFASSDRDESPSITKGTRRKTEDDEQHRHGKHCSGSWSVD